MMTIDEVIMQIEEKVELKDDIVLLFRYKENSNPISVQDLHGLSKLLGSRYKNVFALVLGPGQKLEALDAEKMAKHGWYRKEVFMGKKDGSKGE